MEVFTLKLEFFLRTFTFLVLVAMTTNQFFDEELYLNIMDVMCLVYVIEIPNSDWEETPHLQKGWTMLSIVPGTV